MNRNQIHTAEANRGRRIEDIPKEEIYNNLKMQ